MKRNNNKFIRWTLIFTLVLLCYVAINVTVKHVRRQQDIRGRAEQIGEGGGGLSGRYDLAPGQKPSPLSGGFDVFHELFWPW